MRVAPEPAPEIVRPLKHVLTRATAATGTEPEVVLVEDQDRAWLLEAAALSPIQRARAVIAARSEEALLAAVRLGIPGAFWLPPSTVTASAALGRVTESVPAWVPDPALAEVITGHGALSVVAVCNASFWRCQLGEAELASCLAELATELSCPPALVPGPALVVGAAVAADVRRRFAAVTRRRGLTTEGVRVVPFPEPVGRCDVSMAAVTALAGASEADPDDTPEGFPPQPVHELPGGGRVGWWRPRKGPATSGPEWTAWPSGPNDGGFEWRQRLPHGGEATVADVVRVDQVAPPAVRLPGWVSVTARAGSPAGLLAERMAAAAKRAGSALWLPQVPREALHFVLSLPGTIWIDGPAVPETAGRVDSPPHSP